MPDALATQGIDLLFDSRRRLSFLSKLKKIDSSFIGALQKADPTFRVMSTLNPKMFVTLKTKLSQASGRDPKKRPKDALQAKVLQELINGYMPQFQ